jgi:hypothetical protein
VTNNILSLSGLELRKAVAMAKGYEVKGVPAVGGKTYYSLKLNGESIPPGGFREEWVWERTPPWDIVHTFPLVLEMNKMGYEVEFALWLHGQGKTQLIHSDSSTDPSDAIAKAYLLVRKEMGI